MELDTYLRFAAALLFVLALIGGLSWAAKRFRLFGGVAPARRGTRRLSVIESLTLDAKRRLVLVRCDDADHLLLLGPAGDRALGASVAVDSSADASSDAAAQQKPSAKDREALA